MSSVCYSYMFLINELGRLSWKGLITLEDGLSNCLGCTFFVYFSSNIDLELKTIGPVTVSFTLFLVGWGYSPNFSESVPDSFVVCF